MSFDEFTSGEGVILPPTDPFSRKHLAKENQKKNLPLIIKAETQHTYAFSN